MASRPCGCAPLTGPGRSTEVPREAPRRGVGVLPMWMIEASGSIPPIGQAKEPQFYLKLYRMTWIFLVCIQGEQRCNSLEIKDVKLV